MLRKGSETIRKEYSEAQALGEAPRSYIRVSGHGDDIVHAIGNSGKRVSDWSQVRSLLPELQA